MPFIAGVPSNAVFMRLHKAGVVHEDPNLVKRVVLDLKAGDVAMIYYALFADEATINAILAEDIMPPIKGES